MTDYVDRASAVLADLERRRGDLLTHLSEVEARIATARVALSDLRAPRPARQERAHRMIDQLETS